MGKSNFEGWERFNFVVLHGDSLILEELEKGVLNGKGVKSRKSWSAKLASEISMLSGRVEF
jgi:hypothetical protein